MTDASHASGPQNRLAQTGRSVFGFARDLARAQLTLTGGSITPELPPPVSAGKVLADNGDAPQCGGGRNIGDDIQARLITGLVRKHGTEPSRNLYRDPRGLDGHTATVCFSDMI